MNDQFLFYGMINCSECYNYVWVFVIASPFALGVFYLAENFQAC
jgi:hypothetical protein